MRQLIRTFCMLLFAAFGPVATLAAPGDWTRVGYSVVAQDLSVQPVNLTNTARAPPLTSANVMATGAAPVQNGSMRALAGVKNPEAAYALLRSSIAPNRTPQVTINRQNGAEFEQQVIDALGPVGGVKNTTPQTVTLSNGTVVTTIPDLWGRNVGGLLEAKNVQNLSLSPQLRAQAQIARESGQPLNLVVSPRTQQVSGPLLNDVRSTGGNVGPFAICVGVWGAAD